MSSTTDHYLRIESIEQRLGALEQCLHGAQDPAMVLEISADDWLKLSKRVDVCERMAKEAWCRRPAAVTAGTESPELKALNWLVKAIDANGGQGSALMQSAALATAREMIKENYIGSQPPAAHHDCDLEKPSARAECYRMEDKIVEYRYRAKNRIIRIRKLESFLKSHGLYLPDGIYSDFCQCGRGLYFPEGERQGDPGKCSVCDKGY